MEVTAIAESWIGTPYKHQHATKGFGCDCLGLIRGVWKELYGSEPEKPPNYSFSWAEAGKEEVLIKAATRHLIPVEFEHRKSGDVLLFSMQEGSIAKHCGIQVGDNQMIHSYLGKGVVKGYLTTGWVNKIARVFRYP